MKDTTKQSSVDDAYSRYMAQRLQSQSGLIPLIPGLVLYNIALRLEFEQLTPTELEGIKQQLIQIHGFSNNKKEAKLIQAFHQSPNSLNERQRKKAQQKIHDKLKQIEQFRHLMNYRNSQTELLNVAVTIHGTTRTVKEWRLDWVKHKDTQTAAIIGFFIWAISCFLARAFFGELSAWTWFVLVIGWWIIAMGEPYLLYNLCKWIEKRILKVERSEFISRSYVLLIFILPAAIPFLIAWFIG